MSKTRAPGRLVLGSKPKPDQSFVGFVARLSERVGFRSPYPPFREPGITPLTDCPKESGLKRMAELCGIEVAALRAITYGPPSKSNPVIYQGSPLPKTLTSSQISL